MMKASLLQFRYSWRVWVTAGFVFMVAGWLVGFCMTGFVGLDTLSGLVDDPKPLFIIPMIFGSMTLFFVLGGVIRGVLRILRQDYELWTILGAAPRQVALLVATQLAFLGIIGGFTGYFLGIMTVTPFYGLLQQLFGQKWLPNAPFRFSLMGLVETCAIVAATCFVSGLAKTRGALKQLGTSHRHRRIHLSFILGGLAFLGLLVAGGRIIFQPAVQQSFDQMTAGNQFFLALVALVVLQLVAGRQLLAHFFTFLKQYLFLKRQAIIGTAGYQVIANSERLATMLVPILAVQTLGIGLYSSLYGFTPAGQVDFQNALLSFIVYVGAPVIIVVANIVSVAMLRGRQQEANLNQLHQIGFTTGQLMLERLSESIICSVGFYVVAVVGNLSLYGLLATACAKAGLTVNIDFGLMFLLPCLMAIAVGSILFGIDWIGIQRWAVLFRNR